MKRPGLKRKPGRAVARLRNAVASPAPASAPAPAGDARPPARVVSLMDPELMLERAARRFLPQAVDRCVKCNSTFVGREPAFIHCYYCGKMARIANASLHLQEEFEMRSGFRIAV